MKSNSVSQKPLRIGIVGCGKVAEYHARFVKELNDVQLLGVADVGGEAARVFSKKYAVPKVANSLVALLDSAELDVIHITTPPPYHFECAKLALERGKHVLVEKPMVLAAEELTDLYDRAAAKTLSLCPDYIHLFHPRVQQLTSLIESGQLGRVIHVESRLCINLDEETPELKEAMDLHWSHRLPGGLLRDYSSHALYLALYFAGWPNNVEVSRRSFGILPQGTIDHFTVHVDGSQCTASVLLSCALRPSALGIRVFCEKGTAEVDLSTQTLLVNHQTSLPRALTLASTNFVQSWRLCTTATDNIFNYLRGRIVPYAGLQALIPRFYQSIRNSTTPPVDRQLAMAVTLVEEEVFAGTRVPRVRGSYSPSTQSSIRHEEKVLVTGAGGYVGQEVLKALVREGYSLRAMVRASSSCERLTQLGVEVFLGDIRRYEDLDTAAANVDVIIHLAAGLRGSSNFIVDGCVLGTQNLAKVASSRGIRRVIYMSSMSVYDLTKLKNGQPLTETSPLEECPEVRGAYSLGKRRAEDIALAHLADRRTQWTIVRPSLIVGGNADPIAPIGVKLGRNLLVLSSPRKSLALIHVEDVASAMLKLMQNPTTQSQIYTLSSGDEITVRQYVDECIRRNHADKLHALYVPYFFARSAGLAAALLKKFTGLGPTLNRRRLLSMYRDFKANSARLSKDTGWRPLKNLLERLAQDGKKDAKPAEVSEIPVTQTPPSLAQQSSEAQIR